MRRMLTLVALLTSSAAFGQTAYRLTMSFDRTGLIVPHWQIVIPEVGPASYTGKPSQGMDPGVVPVALSPMGRAKLGALLDRSHDMQPCETHSKGIANMGAKDITYAPTGRPESHCTFNYTDNKFLSDAAGYLISMANTVQIGLELERLHRFDRLGLDAILAHLQNEVKEGRAVELGAIRQTLESLRGDDALMERVRSRAQMLLDLAAKAE